MAVSGPSSSMASGASSGTGTVRAGSPGLQRLDQLAEPGRLGDRVPVAAAGGPDHPLEPALGLLEVGVDQLGLDRVDVGERIDPALGVHDAGSWWARTTWTIASVSRMLARNWLPSPSPLWAPATRPAMSWNAIVSGTIFDARTVSATRVESLVGDRDDRDVRLDRRERVVRGLGGDARQRAEQRRLAGVGHADDPDLHRHRGAPPHRGHARATSVPSAAPASTSLG